MPRKLLILKRSGNSSFAACDDNSDTTGNREQAPPICPPPPTILCIDRGILPETPKNNSCNEANKRKDPCCECESASVGIGTRPKTRRRPTEQKRCSQHSTTGTMAGRSYLVCCRCEPIAYRCSKCSMSRPPKPTWDASPRINSCYRRPSSSSMRTCPICSCSSRRSIRNIPSDANCQNSQQGGSIRKRSNNGYDCNSNPCPCCCCCKCQCQKGKKAPVERSNLKVQTSFSILKYTSAQSANTSRRGKSFEVPENPLNSFQKMNDEDWNYCFGSNVEAGQVSIPNSVPNTSGAITPDAPQLRCAQQLLLQAQKLLMGAANKLLMESLNQGPELSACEAEVEALGRMSELVGNITQLPTFSKITPTITRSPSPIKNQMQFISNNEDPRFQYPRRSELPQDQMQRAGWPASMEPQYSSFGEAMGGIFQKTPSAPFDPVGAGAVTSWTRLSQGKAYVSTQGYNRGSSPFRYSAAPENIQDPNCGNLYGRSELQRQMPMQQQNQAGFWDSTNCDIPQRRMDGPQSFGQNFWPSANRNTLQSQQRPDMEQYLDVGGQCRDYSGFNDNAQCLADIQQPQRPIDQGYWNSSRSSVPQQFQPQRGQMPISGGYGPDISAQQDMQQPQGPNGQAYTGFPMANNSQQILLSNAQQAQSKDFIGQGYRDIPADNAMRQLPNTQDQGSMMGQGQGYGYSPNDYAIQRAVNTNQQEQGMAAQGYWPSQYDNPADMGPPDDSIISNQGEYQYTEDAFQNGQPGQDQMGQYGQNLNVLANQNYANPEENYQNQNGYSGMRPQNNFDPRTISYQNDEDQDYVYQKSQVTAQFQSQVVSEEQPKKTVIMSQCDSSQETCVGQPGNISTRTSKSRNAMESSDGNSADSECTDNGSGNSGSGSTQCSDRNAKNNQSGVSWNLKQPQTQNRGSEQRQSGTQPKWQPMQTKSQRQFGNPDLKQSTPSVQCNYYTQNFITNADKISPNCNPGVACGGSYRLDDGCSNRNLTGVAGYPAGFDARKNKLNCRPPLPAKPCVRPMMAQRLCNSCGRSSTSCECNGLCNRRSTQFNYSAPGNPAICEQFNRCGGQRKQYGRLAKQDSISGLAGIIGVTPLTPNPLVRRDINERCI